VKLLIFGATGATGRALVEQALEQGHEVTAFARNPEKVRTTHKNLHVAKGDIMDATSIAAAMQGQDAVLSALGLKVNPWPIILITVACQLFASHVPLSPLLVWMVRAGVPVSALFFFLRRKTTLSDGTRKIVQAMREHGVKRLICESSLGVGDSHGKLGLLYNLLLIPLLLRNIFADKAVQENIIREGASEWVVVRPAALTNGPRTGVYKVGANIGHWLYMAKISRADVAEFMLKQVTDNAYLGKTPGIAY
jgi:putative NADH-flavin reductase